MKVNPKECHWALGGTDQTGGIEQNPQELEMLVDFIQKKNIKSFFEIGMAQGKLNKFMSKLGLEASGVNPIKINGVFHIVGKSQEERVKVIIQSFRYDMIFVDGSHVYEDVILDYRNYKSKCKYMAFHDILGFRDCEGVAMAWMEIRANHKYIQFIADNSLQASGIGIIFIE